MLLSQRHAKRSKIWELFQKNKKNELHLHLSMTLLCGTSTAHWNGEVYIVLNNLTLDIVVVKRDRNTFQLLNCARVLWQGYTFVSGCSRFQLTVPVIPLAENGKSAHIFGCFCSNGWKRLLLLNIQCDDSDRNCKVELVSASDIDEVAFLGALAHSASHVLGCALEMLYPTIQLTNGPGLSDGRFYYEGKILPWGVYRTGTPFELTWSSLVSILAGLQSNLGEGLCFRNT